MSTVHDDLHIFNKGIALPTSAQALAAGQTYQAPIKTLEVSFVLANITAGTKSLAGLLPTNFLYLGCYITISTALTFVDADTTEVTAIVGQGSSPNSFGTALGLAGSAGLRRLPAGGFANRVVSGASGGDITFSASAGTDPKLADVTTGAGKLTIFYVEI